MVGRRKRKEKWEQTFRIVGVMEGKGEEMVAACWERHEKWLTSHDSV